MVVSGVLVVVCFVLAWGAGRFPWGRALGMPFCGLVVGLVLINGLSAAGICPALDFSLLDDRTVPLAVPLLLLGCRLDALKGKGRFLALYLCGAAAVTFCAWLSALFFPGLGGLAASLLAGTYVGGTVNLLSLARMNAFPPSTLTALIVADNLLMSLYFLFLFALAGRGRPVSSSGKRRGFSFRRAGVVLGLAAGLVLCSDGLAALVRGDFVPRGGLGFFLASRYTWLTPLSLFFFTWGPDCGALEEEASLLSDWVMTAFFISLGLRGALGALLRGAPIFFAAAALIVAGHFLLLWLAGKALGAPLHELILASNAAIGGPTTAAAMARVCGFEEAVPAALLAGALGYALGNAAGAAVLWGSIV